MRISVIMFISKTNKFGTVTHVRKMHVYKGSATFYIQGAGSRDPRFLDFLLFVLTPVYAVGLNSAR